MCSSDLQWALLRGYRRTGITTQFMQKEMDAGDVLLQEEHELGENESARELLERFSVEGGKLLVKTLDGLEAGAIAPSPQDHSKATFAPMLAKEMGLLHFIENDAWTTHNQVRGLFPWPGAHAFLNKKRIKLLRTAMARAASHRSSPGTFWFEEDRMFVSCREGTLEVLELQPEGKRPMLPREFRNGINKTEDRFDTPGE